MTGDEYRAEARRLGELARKLYAEHDPRNAERVALAAIPWITRTAEQKARLDELDRCPLFGYYQTIDQAAEAMVRAAEWADRQAVKA